MKIIINGENAVFGRLCSYAAKQALAGNEIVVVNSDKVIITGNKKDTIEKYGNLKKKGGHSQKGPKISKESFRLLRRGIRGMLPDHRKGQGKDSFKRVKCYDNIPREFQGKDMIEFKGKKYDKFIELKELVKKL